MPDAGPSADDPRGPMIASRAAGRDSIHIAFCVDDTMALPMAAVLLSLAATQRQKLRLHLLVDGSARCSSLLRDVLSFTGLPHDLIEGTPEHSLAPNSRTPYGLPSTAAYRRIMLADHLPHLDRILYLDADILVRGDLGALWDAELDGLPAGAILEAAFDPESSWLAPFGGRYFNSGVMLLDLARWRADGIALEVARCIAAQQRAVAAAEADNRTLDPATVLWGEQTPLNAALAGRWKALSPTWNLTKEWDDGHPGWRDLAPDAVAETLRDPRLFHFAGAEKPWVPAYAKFTRFHAEFDAYRRELERRVDVTGFRWPAHEEPGFRLACRVMALQLLQQARAHRLDELVLAGKPLWLREIAAVARRKGPTVAALTTRSKLHHGGSIDGLDIIDIGEALQAGRRNFMLADIESRRARLKAAILDEAAARGVAVKMIESDDPPSWAL